MSIIALKINSSHLKLYSYTAIRLLLYTIHLDILDHSHMKPGAGLQIALVLTAVLSLALAVPWSHTVSEFDVRPQFIDYQFLIRFAVMLHYKLSMPGTSFSSFFLYFLLCDWWNKLLFAVCGMRCMVHTFFLLSVCSLVL